MKSRLSVYCGHKNLLYGVFMTVCVPHITVVLYLTLKKILKRQQFLQNCPFVETAQLILNYQNAQSKKIEVSDHAYNKQQESSAPATRFILQLYF